MEPQTKLPPALCLPSQSQQWELGTSGPSVPLCLVTGYREPVLGAFSKLINPRDQSRGIQSSP